MKRDAALEALVTHRKFVRCGNVWIPWDVMRWRDSKLRDTISARMMFEFVDDGHVAIDHANDVATFKPSVSKLDICIYKTGSPPCNCTRVTQCVSGAAERMECASVGLPQKRRANESPVQYYKRTGKVDDNFTRVWRGWYYCNPAHCKNRWRDKKERDKHLDMAYAALG